MLSFLDCAQTLLKHEQSNLLASQLAPPTPRPALYLRYHQTHSTEIYTHAAAANKRASELPAAQVQLMSCLYQNVTSVLHTHYCHHHSLDTVTVNTAKGCLSTNSTCKAALQI